MGTPIVGIQALSGAIGRPGLPIDPSFAANRPARGNERP
jgi:hypothetical protein